MSSAERELEEALVEVGGRLRSPPDADEALLELLDKAETHLWRVDQSPSPSILAALGPAKEALVAKNLMGHSNMEVKVAVASCVSEITRITAPDAPYDDDRMKVIFQMIVEAFGKLDDLSSRSFPKRLTILETVAKVCSCVVMLDLECDALILDMFRFFLKNIRPDHPDKVFSSMELIMTLVLEESADISAELISCLLNSVKMDNKEVLPIGHRLGEKVISKCATKLKPFLVQAQSLSGSCEYSKVVASIISDALEQNETDSTGEILGDDSKLSERTVSDDLPEGSMKTAEEGGSPEKVAIADKSPTMNNGTIQSGDGGFTVESTSSNRKPEVSGRSGESKDVVSRDGADSDDLESTDLKSDSFLDRKTKKMKGRKPNSSVQVMDTREDSLNDSDEVPSAPRNREGRKETGNSQVEARRVKEAESTMSLESEDNNDLQPTRRSDNASASVSSPTPSEEVPDTIETSGRHIPIKKAMAGADIFSDIRGDGAYKYYSEGEWRESASKKTVPIINPTTGLVWYKVQACTQEEVNTAMAAAKEAQKGWARTPLWKRAELLHEAARILKEHKDPIAECLVKEIAKPAKDSVSEVVRSGDLVSYTAEEGIRILGEGKFLVSDSFSGHDRNKYCLVSKVPLGVVLAIPPFNYPVNLAVSKIAPALIAGNALVLKPPTQGAVAALHMVQCFHLAGFPKGLISCITGKGSEIGDFLTMHPGVNCISFTGGDTGISISKKAGMIPLQMELGGKDACIVLDDADLDLAAGNIAKGGFSYSGQRCTAVKVVLVMESVADTIVEKVKAKMKKFTVGPPEDNCDITPVVTESTANFIEGLVKDAKEKGATFCQEYKRERNLIWPLLLDHVTPDMRIAWEEPFGPVLPVIRIKSVEEGIHLCNSSKFGLQGCVFTKDINKAMIISDAMEAGTVQINSAPSRGPDHFPFQGVKDRGIGSQGVTNSINMMTKVKTTVINLPSSSYTVA